MKPIKKEQDNKKIISAVKELNELNKILRDTPWVKLDKPIQTGWTKCHKLRDDCASRDDADTFKRILDTIDVSVFCRKQDFKDRKGVVMNAGLKVIRENHWAKLNWPESYKKYFLFGTYLVEYDSDSMGYAHYYSTKKSVVGFKIKQEFYFEETIKPYFVTHKQPIIPEIESRKAELRTFVENNGGWSRYEHIKKGSSYKHRDWSGYNREWLNKDDIIYCVDDDEGL